MERVGPFDAGPRIWSIICPSYHGATLLSLLLGNHSQVAALGDTLPFTTFRQRCGCGERVEECLFWQGLAERIPFRGREHLFPSRPALLDRHRMLRVAAWPVLAVAARLGMRWRMAPFATAVRILAGVACAAKGAPLFVDGFKDITRYLAMRTSGLRVEGAIHLVRDPRAFAASCKRVGIPAAEAARTWRRAHARILATRRLAGGRWMTLRYEDFARSPDEQLSGVFAAMGVEWEPVLRPLAVGTHWIGNKSLRKFSGEVRDEEKWRMELDADEISLVQEIAGTMMHRYGYRFE